VLFQRLVKHAIGLLAAVLLFGTRAALAAERTTTIFWVASSAAARCTTGEDFATELLRRSEQVRLGRPEEAGLEFRIELFEEHGAARGRLTVRERDGHETVRVVPGADCREVIIGLAVIAAILVDPDVPSGNSSSAPAGRLESRDRASSTRTVPSTRPGWGFGAGAGPLVQTGVAPGARPGAGVEAHLASKAPRVVSPLFALGAYYTLAKIVQTPIGRAELSWWTIRASACPFRWPEQSSVTLRPCVLFDAGRLAGSGSQIEEERSRSGAWVAVGAGARIDVALVHGFLITLEAGALAPLVPHRFYFAPDNEANTAFVTPGAAAFGRIALAGRFE
jgi:hypothetical protein